MQPHPAPHRPNSPPAKPPSPEAGAPELLEFVDFKWLMAGKGHRIDLDRLQQEPAYTRGCLALAAGSTCATLRRSGERLGRAIGRTIGRADTK